MQPAVILEKVIDNNTRDNKQKKAASNHQLEQCQLSSVVFIEAVPRHVILVKAKSVVEVASVVVGVVASWLVEHCVWWPFWSRCHCVIIQFYPSVLLIHKSCKSFYLLREGCYGFGYTVTCHNDMYVLLVFQLKPIGYIYNYYNYAKTI